MPSPPYIYNDLRASRARVRNLLPNLPGALIRPPGDRRPDVIAHLAEVRAGGRQAQPRFINSPGLRPIGALAPLYWPLLAPLGPRRLQFVTLSPAPLVKIAGSLGAPAFSMCHAFAGPLGQG